MIYNSASSQAWTQDIRHKTLASRPSMRFQSHYSGRHSQLRTSIISRALYCLERHSRQKPIWLEEPGFLLSSMLRIVGDSMWYPAPHALNQVANPTSTIHHWQPQHEHRNPQNRALSPIKGYSPAVGRPIRYKYRTGITSLMAEQCILHPLLTSVHSTHSIL